MAAHGDIAIGGWGIYVGIGILIATLIGSIFVILDGARRPRYHFGKLGKLPYFIFAGAYLASLVFGVVMRFTGIGASFAGPFTLVIGVLVIVSIINGIAYLLDAVFPDGEDRQKRADYEMSQGIKPADNGEKDSGEFDAFE